MVDIIAAFDQEADDGDGVGGVEEDDASRDHAVEGGVAPQIQQAQDDDDDAADQVGAEGDVDAGVDVAEELAERQAAVAGKGPAQAALPRMARDQAPDPCRDEEAFQHDGARFAPEGLVEEGQDGDEGGGRLEVVQVVHAEEEGDGVEP